MTFVISVIRAVIRSGGGQLLSKGKALTVNAIPPGLKPVNDNEDILYSKPSRVPQEPNAKEYFDYFYKAGSYSNISVISLVTQRWHTVFHPRYYITNSTTLQTKAIALCHELERLSYVRAQCAPTVNSSDAPTLGVGAKIIHIRSRLARLADSSSYSE